MHKGSTRGPGYPDMHMHTWIPGVIVPAGECAYAYNRKPGYAYNLYPVYPDFPASPCSYKIVTENIRGIPAPERADESADLEPKRVGFDAGT